MGLYTRGLAAWALGAAVVLAGCSSAEDGSRDNGQPAETAAPAEVTPPGCVHSDVPLLALPPRTDGEPMLQLPQPEGWERSTELDSEVVRGVIVNPQMRGDDGFTANATVTLVEMTDEAATGQEVIDYELRELGDNGVVVERAVTAKVCEFPSMSVGYTQQGRPVNVVIVGVAHEDKTYSAVVTMQTSDPTDAQYVEDMDTILDGFQVGY